MEFKEKLISSYLAFEEGLDLTDTVHETRANALKIFEEKGFPTKKDEAWKYTSLEALIQQDYSLFPKSCGSCLLNLPCRNKLKNTDLNKNPSLDHILWSNFY